MENEHFFSDRRRVELAPNGNGISGQFSTDAGAQFDPGDADTVSRNGPWSDFFDTEEFVAFDATVAKPLVQPYEYNGKIKRFRKTADELKQAQAQIENLPWTMGHPPKDRVTHADQIRGVWTDPRWNDGQVATLHIPANDPEAIRYAVHNDEISVGFGGTLDWDETADGYDATQRSMAYDHIASVKNGRCPPEKGCGLHQDEAHDMSDSIEDGSQTRCGLHTDDSADVHGHVIDATRSKLTEEQLLNDENFVVGDWVKWDTSNGPAHGKVDEIVREGCTTRGKGEQEVCAEDGDPAVVIEHYDGADPSGDVVRHKMSTLSSWVGPQTDYCPGDVCSCGCHRATDVDINGETVDLTVPDSAQSATEAFLAAKEEGLVGEDCGTGAGTTSAEMITSGEVSAERLENDIAPYLHSHEEDVTREDHPNQWPDDAWQDCGDAQYAAWGWLSLLEWARRKADEIKRARGDDPVYTDAAPDGLYTEDGTWYGVAPDENADGEPKYELDNCNDVKDAYNLRNNGDYDIETETLVSRIKRAAQAHNCPPEQQPWVDTKTTTDTTTMQDITEFIDEHDLSVEDVIDSLDLEVPEEPTAFYDGEPTVEELADDFDAVDILVDEKQSLEDEVAELTDSLRDARRPVYEEKAAELAALTHKWGDEDDLCERFDAEDKDERWSVDDIEAKIDLVEDIKGESTTTVDSADGGSDDVETQLVADNDGTADNTEIDRTQGGRYDLRSKRRS